VAHGYTMTTQGSCHAPTALSASGHDSRGFFFPSRRFGAKIVLRFGYLLGWQAPICLPAERKGAAHQLPVVRYGQVAPGLVVAPAKDVFNLLVAQPDPHPQPVEPHHLSDARQGENALSFPLETGWRAG
jgi:hypothetical protein